jgi:flagellin-specific chaperone FliS
MRSSEDIAKLVEIEIDIEQAKEFVSVDNQNWVLNEVIPFIYLVCNQLMYYFPNSNIKDRVEESIAELKCRLEQIDTADIKGYLSGIFDFIIRVIREYLKELNTS